MDDVNIGVMAFIGNTTREYKGWWLMNGLDIIGIALGTFMVCFYVVYVMKDWGLIKDNEIPTSKYNRDYVNFLNEQERKKSKNYKNNQ